MKRIFKNLIGWLKQYPTCPNCGDSLWSNASYSPVFRWVKNRGDQIQLCEKCANKAKLNEKKIKRNLAQLGWTAETIEQVCQALITGEAVVVEKMPETEEAILIELSHSKRGLSLSRG